MTAWDNIGKVWFREALRNGASQPDQFKVRFDTAAEAKRAPDRAFQAAARKALGTED